MDTQGREALDARRRHVLGIVNGPTDAGLHQAPCPRWKLGMRTTWRWTSSSSGSQIVAGDHLRGG